MKNILLFFFILILFQCAPPEVSSTYESRDYIVYMRGKPAGKHTSSMNSDGTYNFTFEYSDRGRGPELEEKIPEKLEGHPVKIEETGEFRALP